MQWLPSPGERRSAKSRSRSRVVGWVFQGPAVRVARFAAGLTSSITAPPLAAYAVFGAFGWPPDLRSARLWLLGGFVLVTGVLFGTLFGGLPYGVIVLAQAANALFLPVVLLVIAALSAVPLSLLSEVWSTGQLAGLSLSPPPLYPGIFSGPILLALIGKDFRCVIGTCVLVTSLSSIRALSGTNPTIGWRAEV